ncbi:toll/interleukin-1 receptor domain-containing protein [Pseudomonas sp. NFPP24]|uniref:toll/interleukin-1 receptor domain-containing protein n=1 Tax=Pseudomonas sp. NFPP24 TaxID=1566228 RepID=UPI0008EAFF65|nr:toll/interleukin-1 receptor domain-containing protein [Pseudomonas sp. NFPP24]SFB35674.1 TIR domain-containing protein [Pseudomonas sp. NFPP24]
MTFLTQAEARKAAQQATRGNRSPREALNEVQKNYKDSDRFDSFLSHSMVDAELVLGIKILLEAEGQKVYVDWIDDQALERDRVTAKTAEILRKRMRQSNSLLYLATENAPKSKWMPWELGYFDGFKDGAVAVLPVLDKPDSPFEGQEYLGLYPVVTKEHLTSSAAKPVPGRGIRRPHGLPLDSGFLSDPRFPGHLGGPKIFL